MPRARGAELTDGGFNIRAAIAECAYFKAEQRGFAPGSEMDDWLAAEREIASTVPASGKPKSKRKTTAPRKAGRKAAAAKN